VYGKQQFSVTVNPLGIIGVSFKGDPRMRNVSPARSDYLLSRFCIPIALLVLVSASAAPATQWNIEFVDSLGDAGTHACIAIDEFNHPHIAYFREDGLSLEYAFKSESGWNIQTVDEGGWYTSIVLDDSGYPHIAYVGWIYDIETYWELRYAYKNSSGWHIESLGLSNWGCRHTALALDSNGFPHICYAASQSMLGSVQLYKYKDATGWHSELIDEWGQGQTSLVLDSADHPRVCYNDGVWDYCMKYAFRDEQGWHIEFLESQGLSTSMALSAIGETCISYREYPSDDLMFIRREGEHWIYDGIGEEGDCTSLAFDISIHPHICYQGAGNTLKYACWDGSDWQIELIDHSAAVGYYASLALDHSGFAHISYYDETNSALKYARAVDPISLSVSLVGNQLVLNWSTVPDATAYWIYGADNAPYFFPGLSSPFEHRLIEILPPTTTWSSPNGIEDCEHNWSYMVVAVNDSDQEMRRSNHYMELDFEADIGR